MPGIVLSLANLRVIHVILGRNGELRYRWGMCLLNQCSSLSIASELKDDFGSFAHLPTQTPQSLKSQD